MISYERGTPVAPSHRTTLGQTLNRKPPKQDASEWVATLAHYDPALKAMAKSLSEEFVSQTVTGAKIAGLLLLLY